MEPMLKPCPVCGNTPVEKHERRHRRARYKFFFQCPTEGCYYMTSNFMDTLEEAREDWNYQPYCDELRNQIYASKEIIERLRTILSQNSPYAIGRMDGKPMDLSEVLVFSNLFEAADEAIKNAEVLR